MDIDKEPAFIIHLPNKNTLKFKEVSSGLYLYDYANENYLQNNDDAFTFLTQVRSGVHNFTHVEVNRAEQARYLH